MPTIDINDTTLYYERTGQGPAMLFVHGMCGDADVWADQARAVLGPLHVRALRPARPHAAAPAATPRSATPLHADDAAALIEALGPRPVPARRLEQRGRRSPSTSRCATAHLLRGAVFSEPPLFSLDPRRRAGVSWTTSAPLSSRRRRPAVRAPRVDAFFSLVCPGLWSTLDDDRKDRYRDNADIGFTDLRSPSLDVTAADLAAVTVPALVIAGDTSHPSLRSVAHARSPRRCPMPASSSSTAAATSPTPNSPTPSPTPSSVVRRRARPRPSRR